MNKYFYEYVPWYRDPVVWVVIAIFAVVAVLAIAL